MDIRAFCSKIPDKVRSQRIFTNKNPILHAVPSDLNYEMMLLADIWYEFIEPFKEKSYCPICMKNILENYKTMYLELCQLEKEYRLLNSINEPLKNTQ